jgi:hypothetical protein
MRSPTEPSRRRRRALLVAALMGAGVVGWLGDRLMATEQRGEAAATSAAAPSHIVATPESASAAPPPSPVTELVVVCEPKCGAVYVDGKKSTASADAIAVTAGAHDVAVRRPGYSSEYRRVVVAGGESQAVTFQLTPLPHAQTK